MLNRVEKNSIGDPPPKIGTLLVNEGFIRNADLKQAIEIQEKEARQAQLPLGKLLVRKKLIGRHQLQNLLGHPQLLDEIKTFAVEQANVHPRNLARCIAEKPARQPLPDALVTAGYLTDDDLRLFFKQQLDSLKICELAVETGMVSEEDINRVLQSRHTPRAIGEILCDLSLITPLDLNSVLTKYRKHLRLGEILLKNGLIDGPTFDRALEIHERQGEHLGSILRLEGVLSEKQLYEAFSRQYNIPFERMKGFEYDPGQRDALTKIVGKAFSDQFHIVPLRLEENTLTVAISDPAALSIVNSLRSKRVDLRTGCVLVTPATMERLYVDLYGAKPPAPLGRKPSLHSQPPQPPPVAPASSETPPERLEESGPDTKSVPEDRTPGIQPHELVHLLLAKAIQADARSIHIDLGLRQTIIRLRTGENLAPVTEPWPEEAFQEMAGEIMDSIKEIAGMDPGNRQRPQEGIFRVGLPYGDGGITDVDFSVTTCPTLAGENMTIRRITPCSPASDLNELFHSRHMVASLKQVMKQTSGIILVAAPPGNGRGATLYAMLRQIHAPGLKAVTVDKVISFSMPEVVQTQANPSMGLLYTDMLRAALRLDPDVILAEDLGTPESAAMGIEAVRKGVLLLGGINAADSAAAVSTMGGLGGMPQTAGFLKAVLTQRHVRKICTGCKQTYTPLPEEWQPLFEAPPKDLTFFRGMGCPECNFTGYRGRILLSELLVVNDAISRAMKQRLPESDIRHLAIQCGVKTLIDDGLSKLEETTLSEIVDAVPPEAADAFKCARADALAASPPAPSPDSEPEPREETTAFGIVLSSEKFTKTELRQLHFAYELLMEKSSRRSHPSDVTVFETFIRAQYSAICRRYGCSRVSFSVEKEEGKVLLLAMPVDP